MHDDLIRKNNGVLKALYWLLQIGFWVHVGFLISMVCFNYIRLDEKGWCFSARGHFTLTEAELDAPGSYIDRIEEHRELFLQLRRQGYASLNYYDLTEALSPDVVAVTLTDLLYWTIWLLFTYLLLQVVTALKRGEPMGGAAILNIRLLGLIIGTAPVIALLNCIFFARLLERHITFTHETISYFEHHHVAHNLLVMLLIMGLAELLRDKRPAVPPRDVHAFH